MLFSRTRWFRGLWFRIGAANQPAAQQPPANRHIKYNRHETVYDITFVGVFNELEIEHRYHRSQAKIKENKA